MAVILARNGRPAGPGNSIDVKVPLIVARDSDRKAFGYCRVCAMRGERTIFYEGEERAMEKHVAACSHRHEAELRQRSMRVRAPGIFDPERSGDVEKGHWISANREALVEGRKKL